MQGFVVSVGLRSTHSSESDHIKCLAPIFVEVVENRSVKYAVMLKLASIIGITTVELYYKGIVKQIPNECVQVVNIRVIHGLTLYAIRMGNELYSTNNLSPQLKTSKFAFILQKPSNFLFII